MDAQHVCRNEVAEHVHRVPEVVMAIVKRRAMPVHGVSQFVDEADQIGRALGTVVFDIEQGSEAPHGMDGAGEHRSLHAFHVDLDQVTPPQTEAVQAHDRNGFTFRMRTKA